MQPAPKAKQESSTSVALPNEGLRFFGNVVVKNGVEVELGPKQADLVFHLHTRGPSSRLGIYELLWPDDRKTNQHKLASLVRRSRSSITPINLTIAYSEDLYSLDVAEY